MERRYIEELFPVKAVSNFSKKEKSVRHGHISTLHIWWARRPLSASRSTAYAALIPFPDDEKSIKEESEFITSLSEWKNSSNQTLLKKARKKILTSNGGKPPKVLDPFGGGGSIPLEALRLGAETYVTEYNPVANLVLRSTLEYAQKFSEIKENKLSAKQETAKYENKLIADLKTWSKWTISEVKKEINSVYDVKNETVAGYIWARTVPCQNPKCGAEIPLMKQFWLVNKSKKKLTLFPIITDKKISFEIRDITSDNKKQFDPSKGTIHKAKIECLICKTRMDNKTLKNMFVEKKDGEKLIVVIHQTDKNIKKYRISNENDLQLFENAKKILKHKRKILKEKNGCDPIPQEFIPTPSNTEYTKGGTHYLRVEPYGMTKWGDLFNERQQLAHITCVEKIKLAYDEMLKINYDPEYAKIITTYISLIFDKQIDYNSKLCRWRSRESTGNTFGRQSIPMIWDYFELNPFGLLSSNWNTSTTWVVKVIEHLSASSSNPAKINHGSATNLLYSDEFFDAIFTDPPYYDNIFYSLISNFFYVWLKRGLGHLYPELFSTPLAPSTSEVVAELPIVIGMSKKDALKKLDVKTKKDFEELLMRSFSEICRVLKKDGVVIIVYAHKSTSGWETLINSILNSGLVITAAWPINTELTNRLVANESAALSSSIYMVGRKWERESIGFYREIKKEMKKYLAKKLDLLWNEGISGADFFISAIGSAIEVFGKYEKIVDDGDNVIKITKMLDDVRKIVTDYAINKVVRGEFAENISQMTRFYILWRWAYGEAKVPFDDARKMGQSIGIDIEHEWNKGFILKDKEFVRVLGPAERTEKGLNDSHDLIDVLHQTLLIWKGKDSATVKKFLADKSYKNSDVLKRVGQAISESLPQESTEKKWLDGFLTGYRAEHTQNGAQTKLF